MIKFFRLFPFDKKLQTQTVSTEKLHKTHLYVYAKAACKILVKLIQGFMCRSQFRCFRRRGGSGKEYQVYLCFLVTFVHFLKETYFCRDRYDLSKN